MLELIYNNHMINNCMLIRSCTHSCFCTHLIPRSDATVVTLELLLHLKELIEELIAFFLEGIRYMGTSTIQWYWSSCWHSLLCLMSFASLWKVTQL